MSMEHATDRPASARDLPAGETNFMASSVLEANFMASSVLEASFVRESFNVYSYGTLSYAVTCI